jgi:hypothetical protein
MHYTRTAGGIKLNWVVHQEALGVLCDKGVYSNPTQKLDRVANPRLFLDAYSDACGASQPLTVFKVSGVAAGMLLFALRCLKH